MRRSLFTLSCLLCLCALPLMTAEGLPATPQAAVDALSLERDIHTLMRDKKALAGVALLTEDGLCAGVHMDAPFPLLSVIKFPLAVAVLEKMQHEQATLTTMIPVRAEQLLYATSMAATTWKSAWRICCGIPSLSATTTVATS